MQEYVIKVLEDIGSEKGTSVEKIDNGFLVKAANDDTAEVVEESGKLVVKSKAAWLKTKLSAAIMEAKVLANDPAPQAVPAQVTASSLGGFKKAKRSQAKIRLGLVGPSGSGKTMSALLIAYGLCKDWSKIGIVDTEGGSGSLYTGVTVNGIVIGEYNVMELAPPYDPQKYIDAIKLAESCGLEVIILDSISHAWAGEGGLLDKQSNIASKTGNSWGAWREITPQHNKFIDAMLHSKIHVLATMRSKQEYVVENNERGGTRIRKMGLAPITRDGMDYEFTIVLDVGQDHKASSTKDRSNLFPHDQFFVPSIDTGEKIRAWLEGSKCST